MFFKKTRHFQIPKFKNNKLNYLLVLFLSLLLSLIIFQTSITAISPEIQLINRTTDTVQSESIYLFSSANDFKGGNWQWSEFNNDYLKIAKHNNKYNHLGQYISPVTNTLPFEKMIVSWIADLPPQTSLSIEAQVLVDNKWSAWHSWGTWTLDKSRASSTSYEEDTLACLDIDTLTLKDGKEADAFRFRASLYTTDNEQSPLLKAIYISLSPSAQEVASFNNELPENIELNLQSMSQMDTPSDIASRACSPTSLAMILNFYGINITPEECAWEVFDSNYGFGNWSFNTAFAAQKGLWAYVRYCNDIDDLYQEILAGHPVIVSVKYRQDNYTKKTHLPIITGAALPYTNGHLIVVSGFIHKNGKDYLIVHDPGANSAQEVRREYLLEEFNQAWAERIAYIINPQKNI